MKQTFNMAIQRLIITFICVFFETCAFAYVYSDYNKWLYDSMMPKNVLKFQNKYHIDRFRKICVKHL